LVMVSPTPDPNSDVAAAVASLGENADVRFFQNLDVEIIEALYSYADVFLFLSLEEGFGWPIIEAQASGCAVLTTDEAPMNEISGPVAEVIPRYYPDCEREWLKVGVEKILMLLNETGASKTYRSEEAIKWAANFSANITLARYLKVYESAFNEFYGVGG